MLIISVYDLGCEKVLVWDHCLGHKGCEHQTI